jgi:hypothetical protein
MFLGVEDAGPLLDRFSQAFLPDLVCGGLCYETTSTALAHKLIDALDQLSR